MKLNSAIFSSILIFSASNLMFNTQALAEEQQETERWFEVEVILFKQLGDKNALKEKFPDNVTAATLPEYQASFDLLSAYLQPELTSIKQFLPQCAENSEQQEFLSSLKNASLPVTEQSQTLEAMPLFTMPDFTAEVKDINMAAEVPTQALSINNDDIEQDHQQSNIVNNSVVTAASEQPESLALPIDLQVDELAKPIFSTQNLCIISQDEMLTLHDDKTIDDINIDSFGVDSLPSRLNAAGAHISTSPYLIADDSLLLKDIGQSLRWSKEFRPLLHFGWRQVGVTQNDAIPVKLFAGSHLAYQYQQALADYQSEVKAATAIELNLLKQLASVQQTEQLANADNELLLQATQKQKKSNEIFSNINHLDSDIILDTVNSLKEQTLEQILSANQNSNSINEQTLISSTVPKTPLQPWFLDGFFKVHLDHYLYITTDFNVLNKDSAGSSSDLDSKDEKLINFSQNRRVITGEIHYFDHPFIGMIVQIRRFDPTKPADEAVSQAIR